MSSHVPEAQAIDRVWAAIESRLDRDPFDDNFNTAHEACTRYAGAPGRLALTVRHPDGSSDRWTYQQLDRQAAKAARVFARAGLRPGDRIAGLLSRQVESWITALAAWRSGLVYVPLFGGFSAEAIGFRMKTAGTTAVVVDREYRSALAAAEEASGLEATVFVVGTDSGAVAAGDKSFWSELDAADTDGPIAPTSLNDTATLLFTSGTSGTPKACAMTHAAFLSVIPYATAVLGLTDKSVLFSTSDPHGHSACTPPAPQSWPLGFPESCTQGPSYPRRGIASFRTKGRPPSRPHRRRCNA